MFKLGQERATINVNTLCQQACVFSKQHPAYVPRKTSPVQTFIVALRVFKLVAMQLSKGLIKMKDHKVNLQ